MKRIEAVFLTLLALGNYAYSLGLPNFTPISSAMSLRAAADAGLGLIADDQVVSQSTTLNPLTTAASAQAFNGAKSCMTATSGSATWTSASAGQFSIDTRFTSDDLSAYSSSAVGTGSLGWFYTFTSDGPATMTLQYDIAFTGSFAFGYSLSINESLSGVLVRQDSFGTPSSGSLSYAINPNLTYTFQVFDNSNLHQLPAFTSEMDAAFTFQMTPVPEPASDKLLLLGLGLTVAGLRRVGIPRR